MRTGANQIPFKVRYIDDTGISASTLGNSDVSVQTPEGFKLQAEYLGADVAGDVYAKLASYRVTLPANLPAVSSLQFFMNASQVTDVAGMAVAASQLAVNTDGDLERGLAAWQIAADLGNLAATDASRRVTGRVGDLNDTQDIFRFTVTATTHLSANLTGIGGSLGGAVTLFLYQDDNLNEDYDSGEVLGNSYESGTADRTLGATLTPGTYYVYLQLESGQPATNYTLTLRTPLPDTVAPTPPVLDKADQAFTGTATVVDFYVNFTDDIGIDPASVKSDGYLVFVAPNGYGIIKTPSDVTVSGTSVIAHYTHTFPAFTSGTVQVRLSNSEGFETLVTDLAGNPLPLPSGTPPNFGTYRVGTLPGDTTAPTATLSSAPSILVPPGAAVTTCDFVVAYKDNRGINTATLDGSDIVITGPDAATYPASFVTSTLSPGGSIRYATYRMTAPGGTWDDWDNGTYTVVLQPNQVKDTANLVAGSASVPTALGSFIVKIPIPGDTNGDNTIDFKDLAVVAQNYNSAGRGIATGDVNYDGLVGFADLAKVAQNYNTSRPAAPVLGGGGMDTGRGTEVIPQASTASSPDTSTTISPDLTATSITSAPTPNRAPAMSPRPTARPQVRPQSPHTMARPLFASTPIARNKNDLLA